MGPCLFDISIYNIYIYIIIFSKGCVSGKTYRSQVFVGKDKSSTARPMLGPSSILRSKFFRWPQRKTLVASRKVAMALFRECSPRGKVWAVWPWRCRDQGFSQQAEDYIIKGRYVITFMCHPCSLSLLHRDILRDGGHIAITVGNISICILAQACEWLKAAAKKLCVGTTMF